MTPQETCCENILCSEFEECSAGMQKNQLALETPQGDTPESTCCELIPLCNSFGDCPEGTRLNRINS